MTPEELRERRTALGLTQAQFADLIGKTRVSVMRWETGAQAISEPKLIGLALEALERRPHGDPDQVVIPLTREQVVMVNRLINQEINRVGREERPRSRMTAVMTKWLELGVTLDAAVKHLG